MQEKERLFFELSVLGVLASREAMEKRYSKTIEKTKTIEEFFIEQENIDKLEIDTWKEKYQYEINRIRNTLSKKRLEGFGSREAYLTWFLNSYLSPSHSCCYCGIKEVDLKKYFNANNPQYYTNEELKARQRGKYLEIERVVTAGDNNTYTPNNTNFACYICNNAKSDFLSPKSFKPIAKGIYEFWKNEVGIEDIKFPENSDIWEKDIK